MGTEATARRLAVVSLLACTLLAALAAPALEAQIPAAERQALLDLYASTNGAGWTNNSGWGGPEGTECGWYGVTCDGGRVTWLALGNNQLSGTVPASLGNLTAIQYLYLFENQLVGSIPPELGNLGAVRYLYLFVNGLSGSIPPELGNLASVTHMVLTGNQLSGPIPPELGNLSSVVFLRLDGNQLSGGIPPELGNLASLQDLELGRNRLVGPVPAELGDLAALQVLWLESNRLAGPLPTALANLTTLFDSGGLDLRWNAVWSEDAALTTFLEGKQTGGNFSNTETVAPSAPSAGAATESSLTVSWTPIPFQSGGGNYRVLVGTTPGGPYSYWAQSADKSASSVEVTGLDPATVYSFRVQTFTTPHTYNQSVVESLVGEEFTGTTAGWMSPRLGATDADGNGVLEPGEWVELEPTWTNTDSSAHAVEGSLGSFVGPPGATYSLTDPAASYGMVGPGVTASCAVAGNCYLLGVSTPATRPQLHWDAAVNETLSTGEWKQWTLHVGGSFPDVGIDYLLYPFVETVLHAGVTAGFGDGTYRPSDPVTRAQMAIFIARAMAGSEAMMPTHGAVPGRGAYDCAAGGVSLFADISPIHTFCTHVHSIAAQGVTLGCTAADYCPASHVSRGQMAMFMARAIAGGDANVPVSGDVTGIGVYSCVDGGASLLADIAPTDAYCRHAHYLLAGGVTSGCAVNPNRYCPASLITRGQMAKFLALGFELGLY